MQKILIMDSAGVSHFFFSVVSIHSFHSFLCSITDQLFRSDQNTGRRKSIFMSAVFTGGKTQHSRRMLLGSSSQFFQQIGGCNAVIFYRPVLFQQSVGQTHLMSMILGGVNMIVCALLACSSWFLVERVGRRKLFLIGSIGQSLSVVTTFTWLPLPWLYPAEISLKTRAKANAISTCTNWTFNFLIVMVTPIMVRDIKWGT